MRTARRTIDVIIPLYSGHVRTYLALTTGFSPLMCKILIRWNELSTGHRDDQG